MPSFFSLLRKVVIVVPFDLFMPYVLYMELGVFLAEPVSNVIVEGFALLRGMLCTVLPELRRMDNCD